MTAVDSYSQSVHHQINDKLTYTIIYHAFGRCRMAYMYRLNDHSTSDFHGSLNANAEINNKTVNAYTRFYSSSRNNPVWNNMKNVITL
jgi:hypothetical protein